MMVRFLGLCGIRLSRTSRIKRRKQMAENVLSTDCNLYRFPALIRRGQSELENYRHFNWER
jgi:hypothetical protein